MSRNTTVVREEKRATILPEPRGIIDYVREEWRDFAALPFSPVDSLVLSQAAYMHLGCAVPGLDADAPGVRLAGLYRAELFDGLLGGIRAPEQNRALLFALCASPRFRDIRANWFAKSTDPALEQQFCAVTFLLPDGRAYLAFRGTDATVIGWKEDLNMAFMNRVPSQAAAQAYLAAVAARTPGGLMTGGHSKGGNLAVYSAAFAPPAVQDRIRCVYSHDGPGFREEVFASAPFRRIAPKINKTLPQSSLVGMLLENDDAYDVVKSDRAGLMQHDPFSWQVAGSAFAYTEKITAGATYRNRTIHEWLAMQSDENLRLLVDTVFNVVSAADAEKVGELPAAAMREIGKVYEAVRAIDEDAAKCIFALLWQLVEVWFKTVLGAETGVGSMEEAFALLSARLHRPKEENPDEAGADHGDADGALPRAD